MDVRITTYKSGTTTWDAGLLPEAEFRERLEAVRASMARAGVDGLVAFASTNHYSGAAYLSGLRDIVLTPYAPLGPVTVVPHDGEPVALALGSDAWRYSPVTWMDVVAIGAPTALPAAVVEALPAAGRIATVDLERCLPAWLHQPFVEALPRRATISFDAELHTLMRRKRTREVAVLQAGADILARARQAASDALQHGASAFDAYARVREVAHLGGARDVCGNGSVGDGPMGPCEELPRAGDGREAGTRLHLALEYQGYWSQAAVDTAAGETTARRAVEAMVRAAQVGATAGSVAAAAVACLPAQAVPAALAYGLGHGIGLDLVDDPVIEVGSQTVLQEGTALALHAFDSTRHAPSLAAETTIVGAAPPQNLVPNRSDNPITTEERSS